MFPSVKLFGLVAAVILVGCVSVPTGPSVMVMPGAGKSFDQFRADDADCRQFALSQVGGATANEAAIDSGVKSAIVGTAIGAAAGAAMGGHQGAGVGAGVGLLAGSVAGAGAGQASAYGSQRRYDIAYIQCMYAKGHRVPVSRSYQAPGYAAPPSYSPPPPPATQRRPEYIAPPPPPPGAPPPPPPSR